MQQTDSYELSSWDSHPRRVLRRPRFRYGSIIITVICHRSPQVVILQPFPRATPSAKAEGIVPRFCGSQAHHLAITATYLLKVYSIVNESRGFYNPFTYKAREMRFGQQNSEKTFNYFFCRIKMVYNCSFSYPNSTSNFSERKSIYMVCNYNRILFIGQSGKSLTHF